MAVKEGRRAQENEQLPRKNQTIKEIYIIIKKKKKKKKSMLVPCCTLR
jgi:hypothetical protein